MGRVGREIIPVFALCDSIGKAEMDFTSDPCNTVALEILNSGQKDCSFVVISN